MFHIGVAFSHCCHDLSESFVVLVIERRRWKACTGKCRLFRHKFVLFNAIFLYRSNFIHYVRKSKWKLCDDFVFIRFIICHICTLRRYCVYILLLLLFPLLYTYTPPSPSPLTLSWLPDIKLDLRSLIYRAQTQHNFGVKLLSNKWWNDW